MDLDTDLLTSLTNSSSSSSDLDTESTGSFFHDRSTTLGTLMGLTSPAILASTVRTPSGRRTEAPVSAAGFGEVGDQKPKARRRIGSGWWRMCRGDMCPTTLEEFLQTERRHSAAEGDFLGSSEAAGEQEAVCARRLFEDGRVLPPAPPAPRTISGAPRRRGEGESTAASIGRLPVMLAGICSGEDG